MDLGIALAVGAAAGGALVWLGRRRPEVLLALVLASFAIGPQWVLEDYLPRAMLTLALPLQKGLLIVAVAAEVQRCGARRGIVLWPLLAVVLLALQSVLLADLDPRLDLATMARGALDLALPWCLVLLVVAPGRRARFALLLALLATACVAAGLVLDLLDVRGLYFGSAGRGPRLHGASNAGWLACLAFAGFAIALHEALHGRHRGMAVLAAVNVVLAVLTGGRMGIVACFVFAFTYIGLSRPAGRSSRLATAALGLSTAAVLLMLSVTLVEGYHLEDLKDVFSLTGRDTIWLHFLNEFRASPLFGQGLGAGLLGRSYYDLPHNEYLRLLVEGGVVGFVVYGGAVLLWGRQVLALAAPDERPFVRALFAALAVYALTDNILTMTPALVPFVYLALLLGEPYPQRAALAPAPAGGAAARSAGSGR